MARGKIKKMKKNLLLTLTFVLTTIFIGCSKDDNETSTPTIVGKWRTEKFDYYTDGQLDETVITVEDNSNCPDYIEFKSNGTYVAIENDANCNSTADESGTYVYNGTNLTTNSSGSITTITVISLTSTDFKTDFTETSSEGVIYKSVGYFKKTN